ncbi:VIT family protein [Bosea sp. R86505]|uniref:VIT1/CCC1 transporter family protein n=1 Tax=Bosea sp. R86505 TaxID=3101710 RepID=UPI00367154D8
MTRLKLHRERHVIGRLGWLRAAVLGANDGVLSTSSLIIGVASAQGTAQAILIAGVSGMVAGAMSMAAGEYVSVSSQADSENADLARERQELHDDPAGERAELIAIYIDRGLDHRLAVEVATSLMKHDPLGAHARDELGLSTATTARPVQAALSSAAAFAVGAVVPVAIALLAPGRLLVAAVSIASLVFLAVLGAVGARVGGAPMGIAALRVTFWGAFAMAVTAGIGALFGTHL